MQPGSKKKKRENSICASPNSESIQVPLRKRTATRRKFRGVSRDDTRVESVEELHANETKQVETTKEIPTTTTTMAPVNTSTVKTVVHKRTAKDLALSWMKIVLCTKGVAGIRAEFAKHPRTITPEMYEKMAEFTANASKNRYKDVGCWDHNRVIVRGLPDPNGYIHASYVSTPSSSKRFICAQAPLDTTCYEFWKMIIQEKCEIILMLCNFMEKGAKKCSEYYPPNVNESKTFNEVKITKLKEEWLQFTHSTPTKVRVSCLNISTPDGFSLNVVHYHWVDWPDRGVPPADLAPLLLLYRTQSTRAPMLVHCSAGIGRTGSIVLLQTIMEMLNYSQPFDNMEGLLLRLREQRVNSVQTDHQYLYVHMVMLEYFRALKYFDQEPILNAYKAFRADYMKYVIA